MRLVISIDIGPDDGDEDEIIKEARSVLEDLLKVSDAHSTKASLIRDGDRSQGNLLAPKLEGRFGSHYRNKKIDIKELFKEGE